MVVTVSIVDNAVGSFEPETFRLRPSRGAY